MSLSPFRGFGNWYSAADTTGRIRREKTSIPSLRSITLDTVLLQQPQAEETLKGLFSRSPTIEDVTTRHYSIRTEDLIEELASLKRLRRLVLFPYEWGLLDDRGVDKTSGQLPALEELVLAHDGRGWERRVDMSEQCLPSLANGCPNLERLAISLNLTSLSVKRRHDGLLVPDATFRAVRHLRLKVEGLRAEMLPIFSSFPVKMFPNVDALTPPTECIVGQGEVANEENEALPDAFAVSRQQQTRNET